MPEVGTKQGSDVKAFATSALTGDVWIVELKAFVQTFFDEIQFGAVKIDHAFAVDDHFHAFVFKNDVVIVHFINKFQDIRHTGAARRPNA
ncbi:hypothetical protein DJ62_3381 [Yersinia enterocolitica]|nr:hypothetical protein DJ62_3381 [Yersinia enterocolitica]